MDIVYSTDGKQLLHASGIIGQFSIPTSVTEICDYAFKGCAEMSSIAIPDSVCKIGICLFEGCTSLREIHVRLRSVEEYPNGTKFFEGFDAGNCIMYIPRNTGDEYSIADEFSVFKKVDFEDCFQGMSIEELESSLENNYQLYKEYPELSKNTGIAKEQLDGKPLIDPYLEIVPLLESYLKALMGETESVDWSDAADREDMDCLELVSYDWANAKYGDIVPVYGLYFDHDNDYLYLMTTEGFQEITYGPLLYKAPVIYPEQENYDLFYPYKQNIYDYSKHLINALKKGLKNGKINE